MMKDMAPLPVLSDEYKQPYPILFYAKHTKASIGIEGDVQEAMDKLIGRNVYRIRGAISAKNHVTWQDMDIAGPTLFIQAFLPEPYISTMHFEVSTKNNQSLRISISTLYNGDEPKFLGRSLRLPFPIHPGWFVMAINLDSIIRCYCTPAASNDGYTLKSIKRIQACSNIILREIVSAPLGYFDGGKMLPKELNVKPQSKPFEFFVLDGHYPWRSVLPASATSFAPSPAPKFRTELLSPIKKVNAPLPPPPPDIELESASANHDAPIDSTPKKGEIESSTINIDSIPPSAPPQIETAKDAIKHEISPLESSKSQDQQKISSHEVITYDTPIIRRIESMPSSDNVATSSPARCDLSLKRIIGYGCGPAVLIYGSSLLLCGVGATLVLVDLSSISSSDNYQQQTGLWRAFPDRQPGEAKYAQSFLRGHRNRIGLIEVSNNEKFMITAETDVRNGLIYVWNLQNGSRVATMCPFDGYVVSVGFSSSEAQLVTVGTDAKGRHKILIWQISTLLQSNVTLSGSNDHPSIAAKQLSDFSISKVIFDPLSENALVTCGRENIRLWRTKKQHLSGRPILLNEYCRGFIYHDIALVRDATTGSFLYAASNKGIVLKICYQTEQVLSAFQLHADAINTFQVFNGYAVTGGDDARLRIWPMDFGDFLLEARHEGGVKILNGGKQGRKLVIGTKAGTLGLLDVTQHSYETILRSHVGPLLEIATRPGWNEIATISTDRTTRVWNVDTGVQTVEFASEFDIPTAIAYHNTHHALFCGYQSGIIRMFDIVRAATIAEINVHNGNCVRFVKSFVLDGIDVLLSIDVNGIMYLINCETRLTIASFETNISTIPAVNLNSSSSYLCVELFGDNKFVCVCSGGNTRGTSGNGGSAEKSNQFSPTSSGGCDDLIIVYLPSMTIAFSEKVTTSKKLNSPLFTSDEILYTIGYTVIAASRSNLNLLTFVTSKRIITIPIDITDYPQCIMDRSAIVSRKHDCKMLRHAYFNSSRTTIALISSMGSVNAAPSTSSCLSAATGEEERTFSIVQLRLDQTSSKEKVMISNTIRQRLSGGDIGYFAFLKEDLAATSDRFGCLTIWKVSSNNISYVDTNNKDERMVATPSVPSCLIDHSNIKGDDSTPLISDVKNSFQNTSRENSPLKALYFNNTEPEQDPNAAGAHSSPLKMVESDNGIVDLSKSIDGGSNDRHVEINHSPSDTVFTAEMDRDISIVDLDESKNELTDSQNKSLNDSVERSQNSKEEDLHRQELRVDVSKSHRATSLPRVSGSVVCPVNYKGFFHGASHSNTISRYVVWSDKNCVCLVDSLPSHEDEYLELHFCSDAKIHAVQLFHADCTVVALFSTPQSSHHLAVWFKQTGRGGADHKFVLSAVTDSFFTGTLPSTGPILLYALSRDQFLVAHTILGRDCFFRYYGISLNSSPGIVGRIVLPPIKDHKAMDIRVVDVTANEVLLSTQTFVCLLSLGFGSRNDEILWIDEVKSADTIVASYGSFIALQENSGVCQYLHINLCKSAKLRVHLIEHHASLGSRQRPSIRTVLATIPAMESFSTTNPKCFQLLFTKVENENLNGKAKTDSIKCQVYLRMGTNLRVFQLQFSSINQVALRASMNILKKKTLQWMPDFMGIIEQSQIIFGCESKIWTMDGNVLRESLPEFPLCSLLIFKNGLFEESWLHTATMRDSLVLMTMGPSTGIVYDLSSEKKIHEMKFEENTSVVTHSLSVNGLWLALGFSNDFVELYDTLTFKRWYRFSTRLLSSSLPLIKLWFVGQVSENSPGLLMLVFEQQTLAIQFSAVDDHVQHRCVAGVSALKIVHSMQLLPNDEAEEHEETEDESDDEKHISTIDTRLADCLHKFQDFYHCVVSLAGKEGRYEHWNRIFSFEVKKYNVNTAVSDEVPSSSSSAVTGTIAASARPQAQDNEPRVLLVGSMTKENEGTTLVYFGLWGHGVQERSVTILLPKDDQIHHIQRFGAIIVLVTKAKIAFLNQEELLTSPMAATTSASANSLSSCSPLSFQDACCLSFPIEFHFQDFVGLHMDCDRVTWSYLTSSGNLIVSSLPLPRRLL